MKETQQDFKNKLLVVKDESTIRDDDLIFLKMIKKHIKNIEVFDITNKSSDEILKTLFMYSLPTLILGKIKNKSLIPIKAFLRNQPQLDIENKYNSGLTMVAEAIIRKIEPYLDENKSIIIYNDTTRIGLPLKSFLSNHDVIILRGNKNANKTPYNKANILVLANYGKKFHISEENLKNMDIVIDLSNSIDYEGKITSVDTVKILKERLELFNSRKILATTWNI